MAEDGEIEQNREVSPDFSKKHPLQNKWCLWFDNPNAKQSVDKYGSSLRSVYAFDTVEDFWWCVYAQHTRQMRHETCFRAGGIRP